MQQPEEFDLCAQRLKALAEPARLRILNCLFAGAKNVGDLAAQLGDEVVKVSHHLGVLRNSGLVISSKRGRHVLYSLHPDVIHELVPGCDQKKLDLGCCQLDLSDQRPTARCAGRRS